MSATPVSAPPVSFDAVVTIVKQLEETLPEEIASDLGDVEILICENRVTAIARLNVLLKNEDGTPSEPIDEEEFPLDAKGAFIGVPAQIIESDDSEQNEVEELAEGFVVLVVDRLFSENEVVKVLLHELGHALGMDENEVGSLGLAAEETPNAPPPQPIQPTPAA